MSESLRVSEIHLPSNSYLCTTVTELSKGGMEQLVLLPKWLAVFIGMGLVRLKSHICIGNFGDAGHEENTG